jgi:LacI family gluconate utilization system Gnt-I transcriptional repressor
LLGCGSTWGDALNDLPKGTDRAVRVEDVARLAGVSPITVSRALRTPDMVKPETRQRVSDAVAKTGYVINSIASSLRSGQSSFISVLVASLQNVHYAAGVQGMIDAFEGSRFKLTFAQAGYAEDISAEQVRAMLPFKPAAFVFSGVVRDPQAREYLGSLDIPVLEMWGEAASPIDMLVRSPASEAGGMLGEHFAEMGFKTIAYIGHTGSRAHARIEGIRAALQRHGKDLALILPVEGTAEMDDGLAVVDTVLSKLPGCDAMMFGTDVMAAGALLRLQEMGISVPDQIGISGYGDLYFAAHIRPGLTSVKTSPYEVGRRGGELLLRRLTDGRVDTPVIQVPLTLAVRDSTLKKR